MPEYWIQIESNCWYGRTLAPASSDHLRCRVKNGVLEACDRVPLADAGMLHTFSAAVLTVGVIRSARG
jgi:hypothetical protein